MADENETSPDVAETDQTTNIVVVPVAENNNSDDNSELDALRARLEAVEAWQIAHSETHISDMEHEEETSDDDRPDDDDGELERDRDSEEEGTASEVVDRPIRRGIGGFLFGPIRRR